MARNALVNPECGDIVGGVSPKGTPAALLVIAATDAKVYFSRFVPGMEIGSRCQIPLAEWRAQCRGAMVLTPQTVDGFLEVARA